MKVDAHLLQDLIPVQELNQANRERLAGKAEIVELPARHRIENRQQGRWLTYLLDGSLLLDDGLKESIIDAGSTRAKLPLFPIDHGKAHMQALSRINSRLIHLDRQLFDLLLRQQRTAGYEVHDIPLSDNESKLLYRVYNAIKNGSLELPSMPEVALRIRDATLRPDISLHDIARIVQLDPVVAAGVLRAANSAALRGVKVIVNLTDAVTRLGFEQTRTLATRLAISRIFSARSTLIRKRMHKLWQHSVQISALSSVLAAHCHNDLDPEHAQLAGLLHDIGCVPILQYAEEENLVDDAAAIETALTDLRALAGQLVLDYWGLDSDFTRIILLAENWLRASRQTTPDHADLIIVAQRMVADDDAGLPKLDEMPAYARLGLGSAEPDLIHALIEESREQIKELERLLAP